MTSLLHWCWSNPLPSILAMGVLTWWAWSAVKRARDLWKGWR
jgi:hypothetical protein